ncbi:MAG: hypothetical protein A3K22_03735 [Deltaproteobacteria bacterium RBG_16_42_7]|nr:MAG: hypothetical protein A3K22_03735 [Deltaproteobacteria bacterium RBG_16_42_7]
MRYLFISLLVIFTFPSFAVGGYKEEFEREFMSKPWAGEQIEENACIGCHVSDKMEPKLKNIPQNWQMSIHYENNVSCHDCHGGDPKDPDMSMSRQRGFIGAPKYTEVPEFCGKCHVGILKNYLESGHGEALKKTAKGPNCVTCHGSHKDEQFIQKANIDIINEQRCTKCHSYERAMIMKQALFLTEKKIGELEDNFGRLKKEGVFTADDEKPLFRTHADFRALFHTVDVDLVKNQTDDFAKRLSIIEERVQKGFREVRFRQNFSGFLLFLFVGLAITVFLLGRRSE